MKNVTELTKDLVEVYGQTKDGTIELKKTKEIANVAGKIIKAQALQLEYNQFKNYNDKKIAFLEMEE